jgi:hypothetical protein
VGGSAGGGSSTAGGGSASAGGWAVSGAFASAVTGSFGGASGATASGPPAASSVTLGSVGVRSSSIATALCTAPRRAMPRRHLDTLTAVPEVRRPATPDEELLGAERPLVATERSDTERVDRMRHELEMGFEKLSGLGCGVSVFGSARTPADHPDYALARETARRLGQAGLIVITGGGPGIMEAANRGARDVGATSVGLNIDLPFEQGPNAYQDIALHFHYFFARKVMFVRYASAFVVFPGGFGTLDELFEALVLIQTHKIRHFPIVLVRTSFWDGLLDWLRERLVAEADIAPDDPDLLTPTDDPDEIVAIVRRAVSRQGLELAA